MDEGFRACSMRTSASDFDWAAISEGTIAENASTHVNPIRQFFIEAAIRNQTQENRKRQVGPG